MTPLYTQEWLSSYLKPDLNLSMFDMKYLIMKKLILFLKSYLDQFFIIWLSFAILNCEKQWKKRHQYFLQCSKSYEIPNKTCWYMCVICSTLLYSVYNSLNKLCEAIRIEKTWIKSLVDAIVRSFTMIANNST